MRELIAGISAMTIALALLNIFASGPAGGRAMQSEGKDFVTGHAGFDTLWGISHKDDDAILTQEPTGEDPWPIRDESTLTHEFALKHPFSCSARVFPHW